MADKLAITVLGNRHAGKSSTWYELFGKDVRTTDSMRRLELTRSHYIEDVFVINGSPEERRVPVEDIIGDLKPTIVLCSTQYTEGNQTLPYFLDRGYDLYVQWLNPGHSDQNENDDEFGIIDHVLREGATVTMRDGRLELEQRVREVRQFLFGWALARNLINIDFSPPASKAG